MKPVLFIKGDDSSNVRLSKFITFFTTRNTSVKFFGWNRGSLLPKNISLFEEEYLVQGGGYGGISTLMRYPLWMFKLFLKLLTTNNLGSFNIIAINFDSAFPTYLASKIRGFSFIYEIRDEIAISHNFPNLIKNLLTYLDNRIMRSSEFVIHVDQNRVRFKKCDYIIIENTPFDFLKNGEYTNRADDLVFAVIGNISSTRGIDQIILFAKDNPSVKILVVGKFYEKSLKAKFLSLENAIYYDFMPQDQLFEKLKDCTAIFSLYDPRIEINRLAASNKVYDAMMLGIPVITNPEVINSTFISENDIGIVISYAYNDTWKQLTDPNSIQTFRNIGKKGRDLYVRKYSFNKLVESRLLHKMK